MTFGDRLLQARKRLKWSQDELAKLIGTSAPIIGRYERGEIKPSIEVAKKLADTLEVTVDYLIGATDAVVFDKKMMQRLEEMEKLPNDDRGKILDYIDMVIRDAKAQQAYGT